MHKVHKLLRYFHVCCFGTMLILIRALKIAIRYRESHCTFSSFFQDLRRFFAGVFRHQVQRLSSLVSVWFVRWSYCFTHGLDWNIFRVGYSINQDKVIIHSVIINSKVRAQYQIALGWLSTHSLVNLLRTLCWIVFLAISWITYWNFLNFNWTARFYLGQFCLAPTHCFTF